MVEAGAAQAGSANAGLEEPPVRGPAAYVAEFLGTLAFVFFITMSVSEFVIVPTTPGQAPPFIDWVAIGLIQGGALFLLVQTLALISGAHVNPAVTAALLAIRQIRPVDAAIYIVMQVAGGAIGALITKGLLTDFGRDVHYGAPSLSVATINHHTFPGMCMEALGAFFLVWAIVGVAVNPQGLKPWAGLVIGGTLGLIVMIGGSVTGGSYNPARAIGPALVSGHWGGTGRFILVYLLSPIIGGVAAAFTYAYLFLLPGKKGPFGMRPVG